MNKALLVENNSEISEIVQFYLKDDYITSCAQSAEDALMMIANTEYDVILLDILLPGMDGIEFCSNHLYQLPER